MRRICVLFLLCFALFSSANAFAWYSSGSPSSKLVLTDGDDCSVTTSKGISYFTEKYPNDVTVYQGTSFFDNYRDRKRCEVSVLMFNGNSFDLDSVSSPLSDVYNYVPTDEQCQAAYGGSREISGLPQDLGGQSRTTVNLGACRVTSTGGVMPCYNNDDGTQTCLSNWVAESTGSQNDANSDAGIIEEPLFQQTDDPSSCANGYYSSGGNSYCYTGSSQPTEYNVDENGNVVDDSDDGGNSGGTDDGSTGGDSGSDGGSDTGGSTGGGSTGGGSGGGGSTGGGGGGSTGGGGGGSTGGDSGSDGSTGDDSGSDTGGSTGGDSGSGGSTGGDTGTDDGTDDGEGLDGVIDAIGSVRQAINDGFNNLIDTFTNEDGAPTGDQVAADFDGQGLSDDLMAEVESQNEDIQGELTQRYQDLFESDSSILGSALNRVRDTATSWLPSIPSGGGCTPLTFSFQGHTLTIECRAFELIKAALSWILFFFTAYQITMMALSYRNGTEA